MNLKSSVLKHVEKADDRLLEMMLSLAENYDKESSVLSQAAYQEMLQRREDHLNEKSESYNWEQVQKRAKKALNNGL